VPIAVMIMENRLLSPSRLSAASTPRLGAQSKRIVSVLPAATWGSWRANQIKTAAGTNADRQPAQLDACRWGSLGSDISVTLSIDP
jgi:hypothetical protein